MLAVVALYSGAVTLCVAQQLIPAREPTAAAGQTLQHVFASSAPNNTPCLVEDIFAALRECVENDGERTNSSLTLFGFCTTSVLSDFTREMKGNQRNGLEVLHPPAVLMSGEDEQGPLMLTFDLLPSPLLNPVLLLAFQSPLSGGDMDVTFTSQSLQPNTQSVCIAGETQYILLTGRSSEANIYNKWEVSVETKAPDMMQNLKDVLIGGKSESNFSMTPLLLFSGRTGTETRLTHHVSGSPLPTSQTPFLCELKRFLGAVLHQEHPESTLLKLDSLQSLPPLTLGLSSSETLLAAVVNSSAPTVFSFSGWGSMVPVHQGELSMSPSLLEELRQRLEQSVTQVVEIIRGERVADRAMQGLERLKELSAFQKNEPAAGDRQYRAFLLLKAMQTVTHAYDMKRRSTRADPSNPVRANICELRSLTVSLEKFLIGPDTVNIKNCYGSCAFPMANGNNHAVLLNSHIDNGNVDERAPCCVPLAYEALEVVDLNQHGTYLSIKPDVIAKECGCR
ncbi:muellerian-inhibiting factor [Parambassis ranga]|uniref:Muellerian-inhibiting factor n=1 Tax=Parambassis ranga TaxID=210632 RepID=A0A6P7IEF2_9TELE|nr:muellerian-inhibiting factor [Parambassis ranga]